MYKRFTAHLFYKIGLLVVLFSILLTGVIFYTVDYYYTEQDTILDAQELYFYGYMVNGWSFPEDSIKIKGQIDSLHFNVTFYGPDSLLIWFYPQLVDPAGYLSYADSRDMEAWHGVKSPLFVSVGSSNADEYLTYVKKDSLHVFVGVDQEVSSEYINYFPPLIVSILFMIIFNLFIRRFLRPIHFMKQRIGALHNGDLKSKISIAGNDELAELSGSINKMISDIKALLSQKQQLLLDVSHELRSPLARMRLLVEMLPEHKNRKKLVDEVVFLEGMISNLLFSDKLSVPYTNLEYDNIKISNLLTTVLDLVNVNLKNIKLHNSVISTYIEVDEMKMIIALRNLIDNALKYGDNKHPIEIDVYEHNKNCIIDIKNYGDKIDAEDLKRLFLPFFRLKNNKHAVSGFGLGLTICKKIIEAHGGNLSAKSVVDLIIFSVEIPLKK